MNCYKRTIADKIKKDFFRGRAIVILGARRVGKSTLVETVLDDFAVKYKVAIFNGDDPDHVGFLTQKGLTFLKSQLNSYSIIFIDEAQKIPNIGNLVKLLVDYFQEKKQVIITGSSSLNILDNTSEPLTGRKFLYQLFPLSLAELETKHDRLKLNQELDLLLTFGLYPEVVNIQDISQKKRILKELTDSYLYKDILEFQAVKNPQVLRQLLKALSLQVGQLVSANELANLLGISKNTVISYIDLLERSFVIFRLPSLSKNKRREIKKAQKIYFWDVGVRNQLTGNLNFAPERVDIGQIWENFVIVERFKRQFYSNQYVNPHFWRSYDGGEVDYIEELDGKLYGFEIKWSHKKTRPPKKWLEYPNSTYQVINKDNFWEFVT